MSGHHSQKGDAEHHIEVQPVGPVQQLSGGRGEDSSQRAHGGGGTSAQSEQAGLVVVDDHGHTVVRAEPSKAAVACSDKLSNPDPWELIMVEERGSGRDAAFFVRKKANSPMK